MKRAGLLGLLLVVLTACSTAVTGTPTWPGAKLEKVALGESDFPPGVLFDRIVEKPGEPDGAGGPSAMLSRPPGCTDGLTKVIAASAERGPGSAVKYSVIFDGARILMTVLSWQLDLAKLDAIATRCATFEASFDSSAPGIPMTTEKLPAKDGELVLEQTMTLPGGQTNTIYMVFANIGAMALFGMASPLTNPEISAKATLPQTFLHIADQQADRMTGH